MSMVVNHNVPALNTLRNLNQSNQMMAKSLQKLSSGYRINTGADGPADLIISEKLRAQTIGLKRAVRNTQEASNVIGIAEGALNEMSNILKSMRALALHAANDGITSPEQVAADQAEVDSSVQTIDRIANTTKFSNQFLLNGNKSILFSTIRQEGNNLIDTTHTRIDQVFKREGITETFNYTGFVGTKDAADMVSQASKGFMEAGSTSSSREDLNLESNTLAGDQHFILTGVKGAREFSFSEGADFASIAASINNVKDSTGVAAEVVLASTGTTQRNANTDPANTYSMSADTYQTAADHVSNNRTLIFGVSGRSLGTDSYLEGITWDHEPLLGKATDGHGRIYVDFGAVSGGEQEVKLYKSARQPDGTFREEDLVGGATITVPAASATNVGVVVSERNDSGLAGTFQFDFTAATGVSTTDNVVLATHSFDRAADADRAAGLFFAGGDPSASLDFDAVTAGSEGNNISVELVHPGAENQAPQVSVEGNKVTVSLGTDADGNITTTAGDIEGAGGLIDSHPVASTLVTATATGAGTGVVEARSETYLTGGLDAEQGVNIDTDTDGFDHMAFSGVEVGTNTDANGRLYAEVLDSDSDGDPDTINVYKHADKSADNLVAQYDGNTTAGGDLTTDGTVLLDEMNDSGLRIALVVDRSELNAGNATWQFQTGLRLSATEYGRENYVRLQALEGKMWDYYDPSNVDRADAGGYVNVDATFGSAYAESRGTGAQITVNGQTVFTDGLTAELTTPDLNGHVAFHDGEIGATTLAQVGYTRAYSTTAVGQMMRATNMAVNAGVNAREDMTNFSGGMQLQLGEGSGDQERTVYGIQSMAVANLGKVQLEGDWYDSGEITTKTLSMSDLLGGGFASLATDPVKALAVVDQAIEDVASLRARLGAAQKNLLQTNRNSLDVAIENVTSTESDIRDANMAKESTAFTKNQILVQAGTAMLAQANTVQQNVLQLLG